jgi:uncharacterized protein (DUF983 family)
MTISPWSSQWVRHKCPHCGQYNKFWRKVTDISTCTVCGSHVLDHRPVSHSHYGNALERLK